MQKLVITGFLVVVMAVGAGVWLWAQGPQPGFGLTSVSPPNIVFNTPTRVTFTIRIDTPTVNPTTVELQRVDGEGRLLSSVGRMFDNGQSGDAKAGNRIFTAVATLNEPQIGKSYYRVSAAFRGVKQRVFSTLVPIEVWQRVENIDYGFSFAASPTWQVVPVDDGYILRAVDAAVEDELRITLSPLGTAQTIDMWIEKHYGSDLSLPFVTRRAFTNSFGIPFIEFGNIPDEAKGAVVVLAELSDRVLQISTTGNRAQELAQLLDSVKAIQ